MIDFKIKRDAITVLSAASDAITVLSAASIEELRKMIVKSASKSCELDRIHTFLVHLSRWMTFFSWSLLDIINSPHTELTVKYFSQAIFRQ